MPYADTAVDQADVVIIGSGPAGLGAAFAMLERSPRLKIVMIDKNQHSSGGLRNDCKMNFSWPIGFPEDCWRRDDAEGLLSRVEAFLHPDILSKKNLDTWSSRAEKMGVKLLSVRQAHLGTDGGLELIKKLTAELVSRGVEISLGETVTGVDAPSRSGGTGDGDGSRGGGSPLARVRTDRREIACRAALAAPGRGGFAFLQEVMTSNGVRFIDNVVDIGIRLETRQEHYPVVTDYYDPKFMFSKKVRTFCTNSGSAHVVQEKYTDDDGFVWHSVNGHAWSERREPNGLCNFAFLKTVSLTEPLASGQAYASILGRQAAVLGGGHPIMQRVGDFRMGKRSTRQAFTGDLYDFEPTLPSCTPGDIGLCAPAKIMRALWDGLKKLDSIVPGILHPSTIMYYPEIKLYANKPVFLDGNFRATERLWLAGDGAGTSRGITAAWASGIRAADGILAVLACRD